MDAQTTVLDALFNQARLHPSMIALSDREREWSFAEATDVVDAVAAAVRSAGADRGDHVALLLSRTALLPVAMLGVLRACAVLVALDPEAPVERLRVMTAEAGVRLLVTEPGMSGTASAIGCPHIELTDLALDSSGIGWPWPDPEDPAYVVFTSGSTGVPRGVQIRHGSLTNLFASHLDSHYAAAATASATGRLKVAFTMSPAFDACWDQLLWMAAGHHLVVIDEWTRKDAYQLLDAIRDQGIGAGALSLYWGTAARPRSS